MHAKPWQNPPTSPGPVLFTIDDFNRMINAGIFEQRSGRVELIQGELKEMSPASEEHDDVLLRLNTWAGANVAGRFRVASQIGVQLLQSPSMPEPDLVLVNLSTRWRTF